MCTTDIVTGKERNLACMGSWHEMATVLCAQRGVEEKPRVRRMTRQSVYMSFCS